MLLYSNQKIVLATKHQKEKIIKKPFHWVLGADIIVPHNLDTDLLGTFTGEIPRRGSMQETLLAKVNLGIKATGVHLGIASEGSFGPHPFLPHLGYNTEMMVFVDKEKKLVICESLSSTQTNFAHLVTDRVDNRLDLFLKQVGFPSHAVIVRPNSSKGRLIYKGITEHRLLMTYIDECCEKSEDGLAHIETDMRAHLNPTRRSVIRQLTFKLLRRLRTCCPACHTPGFGMIAYERGLACELCQTPTSLIKNETWGCAQCSHQVTKPYRKAKAYAEARFCNYCNP